MTTDNNTKISIGDTTIYVDLTKNDVEITEDGVKIHNKIDVKKTTDFPDWLRDWKPTPQFPVERSPWWEIGIQPYFSPHTIPRTTCINPHYDKLTF